MKKVCYLDQAELQLEDIYKAPEANFIQINEYLHYAQKSKGFRFFTKAIFPLFTVNTLKMLTLFNNFELDMPRPSMPIQTP